VSITTYRFWHQIATTSGRWDTVLTNIPGGVIFASGARSFSGHEFEHQKCSGYQLTRAPTHFARHTGSGNFITIGERIRTSSLKRDAGSAVPCTSAWMESP
jgi:hypothetical protein